MVGKRCWLMKRQVYMQFMSAISLILKIIGLFMGVVAISLLIWKVFGHSPTSESMILFIISLLTILVCANITLTFTVVYKLGKIESDTKNIRRMLYTLAKDFKNHMESMH